MKNSETHKRAFDVKKKMPKITFIATQKNEDLLREHNLKRGDKSKIINKALTTYFEQYQI